MVKNDDVTETGRFFTDLGQIWAGLIKTKESTEFIRGLQCPCDSSDASLS